MIMAEWAMGRVSASNIASGYSPIHRNSQKKEKKEQKKKEKAATKKKLLPKTKP